MLKHNLRPTSEARITRPSRLTLAAGKLCLLWGRGEPKPGVLSMGLAPRFILQSLVAATLTAWIALPASDAWAATGRLHITVVDKDTGKPVPCRIHLKTAGGKPRKAERMPFWQDHFVFPGDIDLKLPLGGYTFVLERGLEYLDRTGNFTIQNFADDSKQVELRRFVDMSKEGWWSGDLDVHRPQHDIQLLMEADDLHVVPLATWWNNDSDWTDKPLPQSLLLSFDENRYCQLMSGGHQRAGGTLLLLNLAAPLLLGDAGPEYPSPVSFIEKARKTPQAWVDLSRPTGRDLPMLVANHQIDSIQIANGQLCRDRAMANENGGKARNLKTYPGDLGGGQWSQAIYFRLLDCGLRLPPSAGSGSGIAPNPVGYNRMYVHVDGSFSYEKWWQNFRAGQVTITNGPLLRPEVEGQMPGHVFQGEPGKTLELEIGLTLSLRNPITYLDLIKDGQVVASVRVEEFVKTRKLPVMKFDRSGWFLIRAVADVPATYRFGMTAPYYVEFDDQPRISSKRCSSSSTRCTSVCGRSSWPIRPSDPPCWRITARPAISGKSG